MKSAVTGISDVTPVPASSEEPIVGSKDSGFKEGGLLLNCLLC